MFIVSIAGSHSTRLPSKMEGVESKKEKSFSPPSSFSSPVVDHLIGVSSTILSTLLYQSPIATWSPSLLPVIRRFLLLALRLLILLVLSPFILAGRTHRHNIKKNKSYASSCPVPPPSSSSSSSSSSAERALSHVLSVVARVPVASRKYEPVRSLADKLLEENLSFPHLSSVNRAALSSAFSRTLIRLQVSSPSLADRSVDLVVAAVKSGLRRLSIFEEGEEDYEAEICSAEKLAAEALWLAQRMVECGAAAEAVARWGEAAGLARAALSAEPRLQAAFVRVSAFLFKQANAEQFGRKEEENHSEECATSRCHFAMLTSWLPLLCRASNGADAPTLSSWERAEMVKVLDQMIEKLSRDQQEVVLSLWLHHFSCCPDSDWPNLESCYTRWYSESRKLLLKLN